MGQWEIYGFLKRNRRGWFTTREIAEGVGSSPGRVAGGLRKLHETGLVDSKTVRGAVGKYRTARDLLAYRFKR